MILFYYWRSVYEHFELVIYNVIKDIIFLQIKQIFITVIDHKDDIKKLIIAQFNHHNF